MSERQCAQILALYERALSAISGNSQVMEEVERARSLNPASTTCNDFIREYAWVVFVSGFKVSTVRRKIDALQNVFQNWDCQAILQDRATVRAEAMKIIKNSKKIDAILKAVDFVNRQSWATVKNALLGGIIRTDTGVYPTQQFWDYIDNAYRSRDFAFMGPTNRRYLAKNLGFDLAKNDRHLTRLAVQHSYSGDATGVQKFAEKISRHIHERISVVETVLFNACEIGAI